MQLIDRLLYIDPRAVLNPVPGEGPDLEAVLPDLRRFLAAGRVDYAALEGAPQYRRLQAAVAALHRSEPPADPAPARAWWINLYNTLIIHAVVAYRIRESVWEDRAFFRRASYIVGGHRLNADDIEHGILRQNRPHPIFRWRQFGPHDPRLRWTLPLDARVHFALVCASHSCPPVRLYAADRIDAQLDAAARAFIAGGGVRIDAGNRRVLLSRIFKWYQADFGGRAGVLGLIARYLDDAEARAVLKDERLRIHYQPYDWGLNDASA